MSAPTTNPEAASVTEIAQRKSMTYEEMRKIYPSLPEHLPRPTRTVECNMLSYVDGTGAKKNIWLPKGTMHTACRHFNEKDWNALAKFPAWGEFTFFWFLWDE